MEHPSGETPGLGVLAAWVVGGQEAPAAGYERPEPAVAKSAPGGQRAQAEFGKGGKEGLKGDPTQGQVNDGVCQQMQLTGQVWSAGGELGGIGSVARRRASGRRSHVAARQRQAVASIATQGLGGEAERVEGPPEPVARAVARKEPSRAVCAVSRRSEPHHDKPRGPVPEARHRSAPVIFLGVGPPL